ncbi:MAG: TIGR03905 family TSCPD domain-containing protein [Desulfovibrionaceae bacterium]|nr:TIGR03905 family TSCPD domain-containing protein [Desulfovibrionaceae bacterium]
MKTFPQPTEAGTLFQAEAAEDTEIFIPENVCAKMIRFAVENGRLTYVRFTGGCDGNLKALSTLVTGMRVEDILEKLSDITCGRKDTSCAAQLCVALRQAEDGLEG